MFQKIYSKMYPVLFGNIHYDATDFVNHWIVKSTKTSVYRERNITFQLKQKIF